MDLSVAMTWTTDVDIYNMVLRADLNNWRTRFWDTFLPMQRNWSRDITLAMIYVSDTKSTGDMYYAILITKYIQIHSVI